MAIEMSIPIVEPTETDNWEENQRRRKEAIKEKEKKDVIIPDNENVLSYEGDVFKDRALLDAFDFMDRMVRLAGREIISHSIESKDNSYTLGDCYVAEKMYHIIMILKPVEKE